MQYYLVRAALILSSILFLSGQAARANDLLWRISPERINIQVGDDRPLQLLDDSAQEVHGAA